MSLELNTLLGIRKLVNMFYVSLLVRTKQARTEAVPHLRTTLRASSLTLISNPLAFHPPATSTPAGEAIGEVNSQVGFLHLGRQRRPRTVRSVRQTLVAEFRPVLTRCNSISCVPIDFLTCFVIPLIFGLWNWTGPRRRWKQ